MMVSVARHQTFVAAAARARGVRPRRAAALPVSPMGNRAMAAAVARHAAARRVLQRQASTRQELLDAFWAAVAAAAEDPSRWEEVAVRLNGFNEPDIRRLAGGLSARQRAETEAAVTRFLAGWPSQAMIRKALAVRAPAKAGTSRPAGGKIWDAYREVAYPLPRDEVWKIIGGSVATLYHDGDTCAARLSRGLDYGGAPIPGGAGIDHNKPKVVFKGKAGDGRNYIVSAPALQAYLTKTLGRPDAQLNTPNDAKTFRDSLRPGQVAVFAGPKHAGIILQGYDDYVYSRSSVLPVAAWKLP